MKIIKSSGETVPFHPEKLQASLLRSGANKAVATQILNEMKQELYEGITTKKIYNLAFRKLKAMHQPAAARYKAKRAIMELGPTGFIFERYVGELFKAKEYSVKLNQTLAGVCVSHEIDIVANKGGHQYFIECKYHNIAGIVSDVKTSLYFHSRFNDLVANSSERKSHYTGWLVTNTSFTQDAITYGTCAGLKLMSWGYPAGDGLKDWIDKMSLYPVTCLTTISTREKMFLLEKNVLLCKDIPGNKHLLAEIRMAPARIDAVMQEIAAVA